MFRWLALCIVLCAGAFALVALATGKFLPSKPHTEETAAPPGETDAADASVQAAPASAGAGHGGAVVLANARLTPVEREDAPSQHDGTILFIGTDDPTGLNQDRKLSPMRVSFPVFQVWQTSEKEPTPPPDLQSQGIVLRKVAPSGPKRAVPYTWAVQHPISSPTPAVPPDQANSTTPPLRPEDTVYRRWQEGDPLEPGKVEVAFEEKFFYELKEGDWVKKGQLVALVDPTVQVNDVALKVNKLETAESEHLEAGKTRQEAERRAAESRRLYQLHTGVISLDAYYADELNAARYAEEERGKGSALGGAIQEVTASLTILKLHEVRAAIPGQIKTIYKHPGESVKNLDAVMAIQNPLKLRVEALAGVQDALSLHEGMTVIVQPTRPVSPLAQLSGHQAEVTCVAVSRPGADGRKLIVSGSEDGTVRFWGDWTAQQPQLAQLDQRAGVLAVACTGPGATANLALTGDRDGVGRIIDLDHMLPPAPAPAAVAGAGEALRLAQAPPLKLSERHKGPITCVAFSPNGAVCATGGEDRAIRLWKVADGQLILALNAAHKAAVTSLQFAQAEGKPLQLVSAGGDNTFGIWKLENFDNLDGDKTKSSPTAKPTAVLPYRSGDVAKPGVSADGKHLLFDHGSDLRVLSLETRQMEGVIQAPGAVNFTTMALFAPDGATILTNSASDGRLQLWRTPIRLGGEDLGRALELRQFTSPGHTATCGAFDPSDKPEFVVTGSRDGYVLVWKMPDAAEVQRKPREAVLSPLDRSLEAGARQMRVWADLPAMADKDEWLKSELTPGGTATLVIPPAK